MARNNGLHRLNCTTCIWWKITPIRENIMAIYVNMCSRCFLPTWYLKVFGIIGSYLNIIHSTILWFVLSSPLQWPVLSLKQKKNWSHLIEQCLYSQILRSKEIAARLKWDLPCSPCLCNKTTDWFQILVLNWYTIDWTFSQSHWARKLRICKYYVTHW